MRIVRLLGSLRFPNNCYDFAPFRWVLVSPFARDMPEVAIVLVVDEIAVGTLVVEAGDIVGVPVDDSLVVVDSIAVVVGRIVEVAAVDNIVEVAVDNVVEVEADSTVEVVAVDNIVEVVAVGNMVAGGGLGLFLFSDFFPQIFLVGMGIHFSNGHRIGGISSIHSLDRVLLDG